MSLLRKDSDQNKRVRISATEEFAIGIDSPKSQSILEVPRAEEQHDTDIEGANGIEGDGRHHHHRHYKGWLKLLRRRLFAMAWVYYLISYRRISVTLLQIGIPVIVLFIFVLSITYHFHWELSGMAKIELTEDASESEFVGGTDTQRLRRFFLDNPFLCHKHADQVGEAIIFFTPVNPFTEEFMRRINRNLRITNLGHGVGTEAELVLLAKAVFLERSQNSSSAVAPIGLVFKINDRTTNNGQAFQQNDNFATTFSYTIRTFLQEVANTKQLYPYYRTLTKEQDLSPYVGSGFLGIQNAIDFAYMEMIVNQKFVNNSGDYQDSVDVVNQTLKRFLYRMFPYPVYLDVKARLSVWFLLVLALILGNFVTVFNQTMKVIQDHQTGLVELLQLHGLNTSIKWVSVLMQDFISRAFQAGLLTIVMLSSVTNVAFLQYQNGFLVWAIVYFHGFANGCFLHVAALFLKQGTFGVIITCFVDLLTFLAPMAYYSLGLNLGKFRNMVLCFLLPNWCLANGLYTFLKFESYDVGVTLSSSAARFADERRFILTESECLAVFVASAAAYFLVCNYVDNVLAKRFIPKQPYFYWIKKIYRIQTVAKGQDEEEEDDEVVEAELFNDDFDKPRVYELAPKGKLTMKCRRVTHIYKGVLQGLDNVSFNLYEDELTILLGNAGSGKSTVLRCIGGLLKPSSGYVTLAGDPIYGNIETLQECVGFSFQPHLFYESLTVHEHIQLCCLLHGNEFTITKRQSMALLLRLNLFNVRKLSVKNLSGVEKRKLSIAMALANNPKILILDLPTQGMDSSERHEIWKILRGLRKNRTIIATATTLDEADLYADRMGLMANGRLLSFSSPTFLKKTLNTGSYIRLERDTIAINVAGVLATIQHVIGDNTVPVTRVKLNALEQSENQEYFSIPPKAQMSKVLKALEDEAANLGVKTIGVVHLTLSGILRDLTVFSGTIDQTVGALVPITDSNAYGNVKLKVDIPKLPDGVLKTPHALTNCLALYSKHAQFLRQKHKFYWLESGIPIIIMFFVIFFAEVYIWSEPTEKSLFLSVNTYEFPRIPVYLENKQALTTNVLSLIGPERLLVYGERIQEMNRFLQTLQPADRSTIDFRAQVVMALSIDVSYTAYYASNTLHAAPCAHNLLTNLFLYEFSNADRKNNNPYRIDAYNHPFPVYEQQSSGSTGDFTNAAVGCLLSLVLALVAASKVTLPLLDRVTGCQSVQYVAGVTPWQYWLVMYICDAIFNFGIALLLVLVTNLGDLASTDAWVGYKTTFALTLICCAYLCCSSLPFAYVLSKLMSNQFSAYGQYVIIHIILGIVPQVITYILLYEASYRTRATMEIIFSFLPSYTVTGAMIRYIQIAVQQSYCRGIPTETEELCQSYQYLVTSSPLMMDMISRDHYFKSCCTSFCVAAGTCYNPPPFFTAAWEIPANLTTCLNVMLLQWIFYFVILLMVDNHMVSWVWSVIQSFYYTDVESARSHLLHELKSDASTEQSVVTEIERIEDSIQEAADGRGSGGTYFSDLFYTRDVSKGYYKHEAISHIYFGLTPGTVFGIMGISHSGKSTLAKVIVGDLRADFGYCVIQPGWRVDKDKRLYQNKIGYLPDTDCVLPFLTGFQHMLLIGRLRGIPEEYLGIHCRKWLELMRFTPSQMTAKVSMYEKVETRRLCCAMAFLGNCNLLVLDEPTTDLDMIAQLTFWSVVELAKGNGQSVIFTSISAQECSDYSTKMMILEDGKTKAIGSSSAIKEQYASGWTVVVRFKTDLFTKFSQMEVQRKVTLVKEYIQDTFSPCELKDSDTFLVVYHVKEKDKALSEMYAVMETIASEMPELINDFLIDASSLDDIMGYFGGGGQKRMQLPTASSSESSDADGSPHSNRSLEQLSDIEVTHENRARWDVLKKQFVSSQDHNQVLRASFAAHATHLPSIIKTLAPRAFKKSHEPVPNHHTGDVGFAESQPQQSLRRPSPYKRGNIFDFQRRSHDK